MPDNADRLVRALTLAIEALNTAPRFKVGDTDSYAIVSECTKVLRPLMEAVAQTKASTDDSDPLVNMCANFEKSLKNANYI